MKSAVISIGNEILLGKTLNSNLAFLGSALAALGIPVEYSVTIKDDPDAIKQALEQTWTRFDVVITTGGLGPTEDDLTKAAIADFFGRKMHFDEEVWSHVQNLFAKRNMATPVINRCQAMVPDGFLPLRNERGTAPGLHYVEGNRHFFALQGVPLEMRFIYENHMEAILKQAFSLLKGVYQRTLHTHGVSESRLAGLYRLSDLPKNVSLAWLPQTGRVDMRFYGTDVEAVEQAVKDAQLALKDYLWGSDEDTPAKVLIELLWKNGNTISIAESCTGGWLQKIITDVSGASKVFTGGVIAYANNIKENILKVGRQTILKEGAVSETCAYEMAEGIKALTNSSVAISTTGIAGPDGGTAEKPVGTVYFGFITDKKNWIQKQIFNGDRDSIRLKAAEFAILELIKHLQGRSD